MAHGHAVYDVGGETYKGEHKQVQPSTGRMERKPVRGRTNKSLRTQLCWATPGQEGHKEAAPANVGI